MRDGSGREEGARENDHGGQTYYFCAEACKTCFEKDPERYAKPSKREGREGALSPKGLSRA